MHIQSRFSPARRPIRSRSALLFAVACVMSAATAEACTGSYPGGNTNLVIDMWDDTAADVLISSWKAAGNANFLSGCSSSSPVPVDVTAAMPKLQYVRTVNVDGNSYPAFSVVGQGRSPLLIFRYLAGNGSGGISVVPLDIRRTLNSTPSGVLGSFRWSAVDVAAVSRGGLMEGLPMTDIGGVTHVYPPNPSLKKLETFSITANLRTKTCTLAGTPVVLKDVSADELPASGSSAGGRDFSVAMTCNGAFPVNLMLTDANATGNTGSRLTPTKNADAQAVRVELLREGVPVVLGQTWTLPQSQNGPQDIKLSARYYREAGAFKPGVVEGQATLTATYR